MSSSVGSSPVRKGFRCGKQKKAPQLSEEHDSEPSNERPHSPPRRTHLRRASTSSTDILQSNQILNLLRHDSDSEDNGDASVASRRATPRRGRAEEDEVAASVKSTGGEETDALEEEEEDELEEDESMMPPVSQADDPLEHPGFLAIASQLHDLPARRIEEMRQDLGNASDEEPEPEDFDWDEAEYHPVEDETCVAEELLTGFELSEEDNLDEYATPYVSDALRGARHLRRTVLKDETEVSTTLSGGPLEPIRDLSREILQSIRTPILHAILKGNLVWAYKTDAHVRSCLNKLWARREIQPSIYQQVLVDRSGLSPSPNELRRVMRQILDYCNEAGDWQYALRVDRVRGKNWLRSRSPAGVRKYLAPHETPYGLPPSIASTR